MFFHHVQEVDDPASDGASNHTDNEGSVDSKNTCECELSLSSLSETEKVYVVIDLVWRASPFTRGGRVW